MRQETRPLLILPLVLVPILGSCDVFDTLPLDRLTEEDVWREEALMRAYVTDLYARFPWFQFPGPDPEDYEDPRAGEVLGATPNPTATNDAGGYFDYEFIRDINVFLENIVEVPITDDVRNELIGEAKAMRAVAYFEKQKRYGGVPLVDVSLDPFDLAGVDERYLRRATEEEIADFVDRELAEAAELLPEDGPARARTGQINRWTALAYKARANLWSASVAKYPSPLAGQSDLIGIPAGRADEFYEKAAEAADLVINSGMYSLHDASPDRAENHRRIFLGDASGTEVIFERHYDGVSIPHSYSTVNVFQAWSAGLGGSSVSLDFLLRFENVSDGSVTDPDLGPEHRYADGLEPWADKDPRLFAMTWFQGEQYGGRDLQIWEGIDPSPAGSADVGAVLVDANIAATYDGVRITGLESRLTEGQWISSSGLHVKKYLEDAPATQFNGNDATNWIALRLAEMYLTKAEAELELGNPSAATEALDATRERAGLQPLAAVGGITRERVREERLSELAYEGHRYWDFRRWRTAEHELNGARFRGLRTIYHLEEDRFYFLPSTSPATGSEAATRTFLPQHYYNPITLERRENSPHLVENPGY